MRYRRRPIAKCKKLFFFEADESFSGVSPHRDATETVTSPRKNRLRGTCHERAIYIRVINQEISEQVQILVHRLSGMRW